jgi:hypothetical protein
MNQVQALFAAEDAKRTAGGGNKAYINLGPMPIGTNMLVRILPRPNAGLLPYVTKYTIRLKFAGMVDSEADTDDEVSVSVPSMKTWDMDDYILKAIQPYWKGTEDEKNTYARPYYHRASCIYGCLAVSMPYQEQNAPDSPIRLVGFSSTVQAQVKNAMSNPDLEYAPWDLRRGRDFRINKSQQGSWPNYTQSAFAYKERGLSDVELAAIEQYGLPDLDAEIGEPPTPEVKGFIKAMYHASLAGEPFQNKLWGSAFRAYGAFGGGDNKGNTTQRGGAASPAQAKSNGNGNGYDPLATVQALAALKAKTKTSYAPYKEAAEEVHAD